MSTEILPGAPVELGSTSIDIARGEEVKVDVKVTDSSDDGEILVLTPTKEQIEEGKKKKDKKSKSKEVVVTTTTAVEVAKSKIFYKAIAGSEMTDAETTKVMELLSKTGTIKSGGMADRMRRAEVVVLAKEDGKVVGCMALRYNKDGYMRRIISRARVSMPHKSLELCWIRVLPSRRDRGVEQEMFARIAMAVKDEKFKRHDLFGRKVFSIWPVEDAYSMALVESLGFTKTASDQVSDLDRNKRVQMFTWGDQPLVIEDRSSTPAIAN